MSFSATQLDSLASIAHVGPSEPCYAIKEEADLDTLNAISDAVGKMMDLPSARQISLAVEELAARREAEHWDFVKRQREETSGRMRNRLHTAADVRRSLAVDDPREVARV